VQKLLLAMAVSLMLSVGQAMAAELTVYDRYWNVTGHEKRDGDKTIVYDRYWNVTGHEKRDGDKIRTYDKYWNPTGYKQRKDSDNHHQNSRKHK